MTCLRGFYLGLRILRKHCVHTRLTRWRLFVWNRLIELLVRDGVSSEYQQETPGERPQSLPAIRSQQEVNTDGIIISLSLSLSLQQLSAVCVAKPSQPFETTLYCSNHTKRQVHTGHKPTLFQNLQLWLFKTKVLTKIASFTKYLNAECIAASDKIF